MKCTNYNLKGEENDKYFVGVAVSNYKYYIMNFNSNCYL